MKDNKDILNEAFFKKASYAEKLAKKLPQYAPVDTSKKSSLGYASSNMPLPAYQVSDTDEVKKRLAGAFGVTFGNNNIRNMASRAIKEFPIIISDSVEPETAIMLKKLMEEQYAEYINLLISNQVVNLADYTANDENGNIAIQALDSISGTDFKKSRIANTAARTNDINADTLFANIPLYNLLRENQMVLTSGDSIMDSLLEGACVVPSENVKELSEFIFNNVNEIVSLTEDEQFDNFHRALADRANRIKELEKENKELKSQLPLSMVPYNNSSKYSSNYKGTNYSKNTASPYSRVNNPERQQVPYTGAPSVRDVNGAPNVRDSVAPADLADDLPVEPVDNGRFNLRDILSKSGSPYSINKNGRDILDKEINKDLERGYRGLTDDQREVYDRLTTADIVLDTKQFDSAINRTVGEFLVDPNNKEIRENFELATFLLQSRMISGIEYYQYLTMRLGMPVSDNARRTLITKFKMKDVRAYGKLTSDSKDPNSAGFVISDDEVAALASNRVITNELVKEIGKTSLKTKLEVAGTAGAGIGTIAAGIALISNPVGLAILSASAVGAAGFLIHKILHKKPKLSPVNRGEGWERVEYLVEKMKNQRNALTVKNSNKYEPLFIGTSINPRLNKIDVNMNKDLSGTAYNADATENNSSIYDYDSVMGGFSRSLAGVLKEDIAPRENTFNFMQYSNTALEENCANLIDVLNETKDDKYLQAQILTEKTLAQTSMPMTVKYIDKPENKDVLITPSFMARDNYAYGETEIERKDMNNRKYNQPLIMTVKFKERFSDGKYTDNELTAVIGILGKIIRVPSSEMEYILSENIGGNTVEGIFKADIKDTVSDLLSTSKISKDLKNLPQSADIWKNLEKVATLAAANKLSGKRNGNIANAHIVFSQKEIDAVRNETGVDYLKDVKKSVGLMKRYSAFTLMVASDAGQRVYILDDQDNISWNVVPYSALTGKDSGDQLNAALTKMMRL